MNKSAQKSRLYRRKNPRPKFHWRKTLIFLVLGALAFVIGYMIFGPHIWDGTSRLSIAIQKKDSEDVIVATYDPQAGSVTTIKIPGNTEVNASKNLGIWKLSTISKLGENEKINGGKFLAATITKSFRFPIEGWAEEEILDSGFSGIFKSTRTNLYLKDKIALALFSLNVKSTGRINLDLSNTDYLTEAKLSDGSNGFEIAQNIPVKISSIFTDTNISKRNVNVVIIDRIPSDFITSRVGEIIEVLGGKIATIEKLPPDSTDCLVKGKDDAVGKIARLFDCKISKETLLEKEDVEIIFGQNFKKRF